MTTPRVRSALRDNVRRRLGNARSKLGWMMRRGYDRARAIDPAYTTGLLNRGAGLLNSRRFTEALTCYDRALKIRPENAAALYDRAVILRHLKRSDEALASLNRALALKPEFADALVSRAKILRLHGQIEEAIRCLREAVRLRPDDAKLHTLLIFSLNFDPRLTEVDKQRERAEWNRRHAQKFRAHWRPHGNEPDPERRLRIGYVSKYFRHDNAAYGFGNAILHRDSERFELFCYSDADEDDVTAQLRAKAHHWHRTRELSDEQLAELIRRDQIDILIDCVGHMNGNRLLVLARKPAPVQVTAWGEPTGTGLEAIDYLFSSPVLVPESERGLFAERVIDFPNFTGFWSPDSLPDVVPLPALKQGHVTFGSFNRATKINPQVIGCWASILKRVPGARLILKHMHFGDAAQQWRITKAFELEGVPALSHSSEAPTAKLISRATTCSTSRSIHSRTREE